jgi:DNA recombination protein RmuC
MLIVYLLIGLVLGFALAFFYFKSKGDPNVLAVQETEKQKAVLADRVQTLEKEKRELDTRLDAAKSRGESLFADLARTQEMLRSEETRSEEFQQDREQLKLEFENLANKILEEKTEKFTTLNKKNLDDILSPLQERIKEFHEKVDSTYSQEARERNTLRGEIMQLVRRNEEISEVANNLAKALKGDTKQQGNWGELILEKVLEYSGLRKGEEYKVQETFASENGRQRPDVTVYLPDSKHLIIDSKVSLTAYERCVSAEDEGERARALKEHIESVRSHVKGLAEKNYQAIPTLNQPDFVLMFMPIESSFGLAIQTDSDLFNFAWERRVVIVSPSTLLATLRTIASTWKQERQTRNAIEIADRAGKMYDKFEGFVRDLLAVGKKMDDAKESYEDAMKKLSTGPGNLVRQAEQLKEMGAKATKALPQNLLDRSE